MLRGRGYPNRLYLYCDGCPDFESTGLAGCAEDRNVALDQNKRGKPKQTLYATFFGSIGSAYLILSMDKRLFQPPIEA